METQGLGRPKDLGRQQVGDHKVLVGLENT